MLVRGWHRSIGHFLPGQVADQCCGKNSCVPLAIAKWFAAKLRAGAELDLSAAFDTIYREVAHAAIVAHGTPTHLADTLVRAWRAS